MINFEKELVSEVNIGTVGHVDHGKTTLVQALTKKWADTHSEELRRGITIRLGYADAIFYYCEKCNKYRIEKKCSCDGEAVAKRAISFIDAPGHETLMATVLSGTSLMDGALLVIAANEKCPQPQTFEHLKTLDVVGIKNIVIVQNKIDLVSDEEAKENYKQIKEFVSGTVAENAPIVPVSAVHNSNIDVLIEFIEKAIPTPQRDTTKNPKFYIARSFDINKPGKEISKLVGGVIGGSLVSGILKKDDEIEIRPGANINEKWKALESKIVDIIKSGHKMEVAKPGGLVALQTELDPALTKSDNLSGHIAALKGTLPEVQDEIKFKANLFDYVIGVSGHQKVGPIKTGDALMLTVGIAKTVGSVISSGNVCHVKLKLPVCVEKNDKISLSRQVAGRWHLIGWGEVI